MWKVEYTRRFLRELSKLPNKIQVQAEKIVFEELPSVNPFALGYLENMINHCLLPKKREKSKLT